MPALVLDLPFTEYEAWARDLDLIDDNDVRLAWKKILGRADIGKSQQYVIKSRWGENPEQMAKLHALLKDIELERAERTPAGARMLALERWAEIGRDLSDEPEWLNEEIERLSARAASARKRGDARRLLAEPSGALTKTTPEPKRPRK